MNNAIPIELKAILVPLLIGALGGLIGTLCGVGGGVLMVPAFVMILGLSQQNAVATSLAVIASLSIVATSKNAFSEPPLIDWRIFVPAAIGAMTVAWFASDLLRSLSNVTLQRIFAIVLLVFGTVMLFRKG